MTALGLLAWLFAGVSWAAPATGPRVLIVVAHPDDEYCFAATVYRVTRELGGHADQLVITNGEGGFRYSLPSEPLYGKELTTEAVGRKHLPAIRKKELEGSGRILGISRHFHLDQKDFGYSRESEPAFKNWDRTRIDAELLNRLRQGRYDFVFTLLPTADTHGHHKAAALFALDAVHKLTPKDRPVVLGCWNQTSRSPAPLSDQAQEIASALEFVKKGGLEGFPQTRVLATGAPLLTDRNASFGFKRRLSYQIYVNWMIAEHKSQGLFQTYTLRDDSERFEVFGTDTPNALDRAQALFSKIK